MRPIVFGDLHIARKTDQYNQGDFKRLEEAGGTLRHLTALASYFRTISRGPNSEQNLFGADIRGRLSGLMRMAAIANMIDPSRIGTHSLRSGGSNAMFATGYDSEIIKRLGRLKSASFSFYLRNDDRALSTVGKGMMNSAGLLDQLRRQSDRDRLKQVESTQCRAGGKDYPQQLRGRSYYRVEAPQLTRGIGRNVEVNGPQINRIVNGEEEEGHKSIRMIEEDISVIRRAPRDIQRAGGKAKRR